MKHYFCPNETEVLSEYIRDIYPNIFVELKKEEAKGENYVKAIKNGHQG